YDRAVKDSFIIKDLWKRRNMRLAFKSGFYWGSVKAGLMQISGGRLFGKRIEITSDSQVPRKFGGTATFQPDGKLTFSKLDSVFKSGNATRDNIPSHLIAGENLPPEVGEFYSHVCPAGVYEVVNGKLHINPPNCIDCKATDVVAPRWTPRESGSGPRYKRM
ncbi:MAG: 4Fe-4S dicluster domain-containing protein, partial [candidate division Zixibacteria bacterium]|nr:4Fe-4S dicluster domain-containing protein [candidate division Zixibacteria bacterium]